MPQLLDVEQKLYALALFHMSIMHLAAAPVLSMSCFAVCRGESHRAVLF